MRDQVSSGNGDTERRQRRLAKNESFFRESNELIERDATLRGGGTLDVICECSSRGCVDRLALSRAEYEHVRARGDHFVVVPGHEDPSIEVVVERQSDYVIVEKRGAAGVEARADDVR